MPKPTFVSFYSEHKAELEKEKPNLTPAELTKYAMNKFRELYAGKPADVDANGKDDTNKSNGSNAKRKINIEDNQRSGIAKLARFSFNKP